jgi:hypothetical protein
MVWAQCHLIVRYGYKKRHIGKCALRLQFNANMGRVINRKRIEENEHKNQTENSQKTSTDM